MASFPTSKVHRSNRRKAGRNQAPSGPTVPATVTLGPGNTAIVSFASPVVVSGPLPLSVGNLTVGNQTVDSPTQVTIELSGNASGQPFVLQGGTVAAANYHGGGISGAAGTF